MERSLSRVEPAKVSRWFEVDKSIGITLIEHLFNRLGAMYLQKWSSCFKNEFAVQDWKDTWAQILDEENISFEQIKVGLTECRKLHKTFPPTVQEFIDACKTVVPQAHRNFAPALVHKQTPEERQAGLNKLKEMSEQLFERKKA